MGKSMEKIVEVPEGVSALVNGKTVTLEAAGKRNVRTIKSKNIEAAMNGQQIVLHARTGRRNVGAELGTVASHIRNMIEGLQKGYEYRLEVVYSHFPMTITVKEGMVEIANLSGMKDIRKARIIGNTEVRVKGKEITVTGHNKEEVGQTSANLEQATRIKGRDIRVFQDGIYRIHKGVAPEKDG